MTTVMYVSDSNIGRVYDAEAFGFIQNALSDIHRYSSAINVSETAAAGALAEENHSVLERGWADAALDFVSEGIGNLDWDGFYEEAKNRNRTEPPSRIEKALNPALVDAGPANIKIATAIDLLLKYEQTYGSGGSDTLDLLSQGYLEDYGLFVSHLISDESGLSAKIYALVIQEAEQWFTSKNAYGADWSDLPQEFKDALYVTYANFGKPLIEKCFTE